MRCLLENSGYLEHEIPWEKSNPRSKGSVLMVSNREASMIRRENQKKLLKKPRRKDPFLVHASLGSIIKRISQYKQHLQPEMNKKKIILFSRNSHCALTSVCNGQCWELTNRISGEAIQRRPGLSIIVEDVLWFTRQMWLAE